MTPSKPSVYIVEYNARVSQAEELTNRGEYQAAQVCATLALAAATVAEAAHRYWTE